MQNSWIRNWFIVLLLITAAPLCALGQYGGGGGGGMGTGSTGGGYTPPKGGYSSSAGIAIGAAAAAGVAIAYLELRHRGMMTGCVKSSSEAGNLTLVDGTKSYALDPGSLRLPAGERVKLHGKKEKTGPGAGTFRAQKLVKDYGPCTQEASAPRGFHGGRSLR
jgi:hypothetical protein